MTAPGAAPDDFAAAVDGLEPAPEAAPAPGAALASVRKYPPFVYEDWKDNPVAMLINSGANVIFKAPEGAAEKARLGETYCWAISCYTSMSGDMPPWLVAIVATGQFVLAVMLDKATAKRNNAAAENPREGEAQEDARMSRFDDLPARPRTGSALDGVDWGDG